MIHLHYARSAVLVSSNSNRWCRARPHLQRLQCDMRLNNNTRRRIINPQLLFGLRSKSNSSSRSQNYPFTIHDDDNPFEILGVPKTSSYEVVKRRFVELALKHHPDISNNKNDDNNENDSSSDSNVETSNNKYDRERNMEIFIRLRKAFETIRENEDGTTRLYDNNDDGNSWSDDEFFAWFYEETGHQDVMFKMDVKTRKEVIKIVKTEQSQGGLDKGGMWELARSMAQEEDYLLQKKNRKKGALKTNKAFKGIDSGQTPQPKIRRRRR